MKSLNRPAKIMLILLSAVVLTVLVIVANVARSRSQVRGIEVAIRYDGIPHLVSDQTVVDTVLRRMPNLMQLSVKNVDCKRVASAARRVPFLTRVSSSVSVGGKVVVRAEQRRPIARLYYGNREFYIDCEGVLFHLRPSAIVMSLWQVAILQSLSVLTASTLRQRLFGNWLVFSMRRKNIVHLLTRFTSSAMAT